MSKQSVFGQGRQGTQHAAKGDIATGFKTSRGTVEKAEGRQDTVDRPSARRSHFRRGIFDGPRGLIGGSGWQWNGCWLPWLEGAEPDQSPLLDRLAERVELEAQFLGDFAWAPTSPEQLLCLGCDLWCHHRRPTGRTRRVERPHAPGAVPVDTANDADLRDAEGPHNVHRAASALEDQLSGKHPESAAVTLGVLEHRLGAAEVDPLAIVAHHADQIADPRGTIGDERQ